MGTLYLVSTPIGNMEDITLRAIKILSSVETIACEDTRKTGLLLVRHQIVKRANLLSFYEENENFRLPQIISLLKEGKDVALVTNAGTPLLSDPGFTLVREAVCQGIKIVAIPGPSALLAALVTTGFPTDKFLFLGFLPKKPGKQEKVFKQIKAFEQLTIILYESPYRLIKTLSLLKTALGDVEGVVCRELTKVHEEMTRGTISELIDTFQKRKIKGEITLVLNYRQT